MNYNISAASYRGYGFLDTVSKTRAKSMEKLASGYRINHASDDAANTSITAIMRSQIRGLEQANRNSDDGIALLNSADSGLEQINNILQRIRELAVGAANDTKVEADRQATQAEVNELLNEIDRIARTTEYNTIKLLNNEPVTTVMGGRGLRDVVGTNNITPDGKLSERYNTWQMLDPATQGNNATNYVYRTERVTNRIPTSSTMTTGYDLFQLNGQSYTGTLYDSSGTTVLGTVSGSSNASLSSAAAAYLPVTVTPQTPPAKYTASSTIQYNYTTPSTTPNGSYSNLEKSKTTISNVAANSSQVYGKDSNGNLIPLSYRQNNTILESGNLETEYRDLNQRLASASIDFKDYNVPGGFTNSDLYNTGFNSTCATCSRHYSLKFVSGTTSTLSGGYYDPVLEVGIDSLPANATGTDLANHILNTIKQNGSFAGHYTQYAVTGSKLYIFDNRTSVSSGTGSDTFDAMVYGEPIKTESTTVQLPMKIQAGADSYNTVDIILPFVSTKKMGIENLDVMSHETASETIPLVDDALQFITKERSKIGTYVNRLQHVSNVDETSALANTESESKIHDTEYGSEMLQFTKARIIEEFGTNSVAEINKMIENVLEFIK